MEACEFGFLPAGAAFGEKALYELRAGFCGRVNFAPVAGELAGCRRVKDGVAVVLKAI